MLWVFVFFPLFVSSEHVADICSDFQVDLLHFGGKDLHAGVAHRGGEPHSGDLPAGGAVLFWLTVAVRTLRLHRGHREDGRRPCKKMTQFRYVALCSGFSGWRR